MLEKTSGPKKGWRSQSTPNADRIHDCGMFLGNAPFPIEDQIGLAVEVMKRVLTDG